jgi:cell division protein DivIC
VPSDNIVLGMVSMKHSKKEKKRLIFITCLIVLCFGILFYICTTNLKTILDYKKRIKELDNTYEELVNEEKSLKSEVIKLKDPDYLARYAKEKYLYSSDNEIIIRGK